MSVHHRCGRGWSMPVESYNNRLYPLQDKVLALFAATPFYLTGGTALSRGYYQHRYSDDLDLFVNGHPDFSRLAASVLTLLRRDFAPVEIVMREEMIYRLFLGQEGNWGQTPITPPRFSFPRADENTDI